jgi:hypothetical protein
MQRGYWLIHDLADDHGFDWSLWRWVPDSPLEDSQGIALDEIVVAWTGEPRNADHAPGAPHEEGWDDRYVLIQLDDVEAEQLTLGAHHSVFHKLVERLLLARSIDLPPKREKLS